MSAQLRLYPVADDLDLPELEPQPSVSIRLRDLLPVIALAQRLKFIWLNDFLDDEVMITDDLYEVMQTFRATRTSA